jgi:adenosylcobinamide-phosphate synthase
VRRRTLALVYALDALIGDPPGWPHPVRLFGAAISAAERRRDLGAPPWRALAEGALLTGALAGAAFATGTLAERRVPALAIVLGASSLAARSLDDAVGAVQDALARNDLAAARRALARIVGRDVEHLDASGVSGAALESLAESFCDGFVAPLFWLRARGTGAALAFKAISTLDSMIGHREPPHTYFGRVAARADDLANFIPARLATLAIIVAALLTRTDPQGASATALRDAPGHASPNAGWPEAALAGALRVRLGGDAWYDGVRSTRARLGAEFRPAEPSDVARGRRVIRVATLVTVALAVASAR